MLGYDWIFTYFNVCEMLKGSLTVLISVGVGVLLRIIIHCYPEWLKQHWQYTAYCYLAKEKKKECACYKHPHNIDSYNCFLTYVFKQSWRDYYRLANVSLPIIEIMTVMLTVVIVWHSTIWLASLLFCYFLLVLMFIDLQRFLLPDVFTLSLLWAGLLVNLIDNSVVIEHAVLGALCGYLSLWVMYWIVKLSLNIESIGYGDFKLLAALGAWFGWQKLPEIILFASISALIALSCVASYYRDKSILKQPVAFGTYLALAGIVMHFRLMEG